MIIMPQFWIPSAIALLIAEVTLCEDCKNITVKPESTKWSIGTKEITFLIDHNCSETTAVEIRWSIGNGSKLFEDGNISTSLPTDVKKQGQWTLTVNGSLSTNITLSSKTMQNSTVIILTNSNITSNFTIIVENCQGGGVYQDERDFNCKITSYCTDTKDVQGKKHQECGKFAEWISGECKREKYVFDFSSSVLKAAKGRTVEIKCDKSSLKYAGILQNGTISMNLSYEDHGKLLLCYDTHVNDTDAKTATVNVTSRPTFQDVKSEAVEGQPFNLRFMLYANPPVLKSGVDVLHPERGNITDFFFRSVSEISQEIMIYFPEVTANDFGVYNVTVTGEDEYCNHVTEEISTEMTGAYQQLSVAWIVAICLGVLVLASLISTVVLAVKLCRRRNSDEKDISPVVTKITKPIRNVQKDRNHEPDKQFTHANQSFDDEDDDEFDDDDYEQPTAQERPPMPLPPTARGAAPPPSRSPRHLPARPTNNRHQPPPPSSAQRRPLPSPGTARPSPNRGMLPPRRGVGAGNTLSPRITGYEPRDCQEDYLNEDESRAATIGRQQRHHFH